MARLISNNLILVAFYIATITITATLISAKSSSDEQESLFECRKHVGSTCGDQIVDTLSNPNKTTISTECCYKVIQTGYSCHSRLTLFVSITDAAIRKQNSTEVMAKNDHIYNKCDKITKPEKWEFLSGCVVKVGSECGKEVFHKLVHGEVDVTKHCCEKLMKTGLSCHVNMAKALIRAAEMRDVDAVQLLNKGKEMFDQCRRHVK